MREILSRLRASLTPQALAVLAAILLFLVFGGRQQAGKTLEERISRTLSHAEGAGRVEVTIHMRELENGASALGMEKKKQSVPCGAVAVAQGADDPLVAIQLHEALCALLGLAPSAVSVISGEAGGR